MSAYIKRLLLITFALTLFAFAVGFQVPQRRQELPEKPPSVTRLEFTGPREGWPPRPRGQTNVRDVTWREIPGSLTDALEARIRRAALRDARVRSLLGSRFAYISTDEVERDKSRRPIPFAPLVTRVTFFSHTNNVAVEAQMLGLRVRSVNRKADYQPPEGQDEIVAAVSLARSDARLRDNVQGLTGEAVVASPRSDQPGYGHRVLYVAFSRAEDDRTLYSAIVDLTDQKVLSAGPAGGRR